MLRKTVGQQTGVRYTPSLTFIADVVPETAGQIEELLEQARLEDAPRAVDRRAAAPAGDADPYRVPRALEDGEPDGALTGRPERACTSRRRHRA